MSATASKKRTELIRKKYAWIHDDLKHKRGLGYNHGNSTVPGCRVIEATFIEHPAPIGVIWYRHIGGSVLDILGMFVVDYYRRCGVATYMLEKMVASFPKTTAVVTGDGTEYGSAWMRAVGFKKQPNGEWIKAIRKAAK